MKLSIARKWKIKERKYNQKYKLKSLRKSSQIRDFSGKFLFLFSKNNSCTIILKFLTHNVCITTGVITINSSLYKHISSKYVLSSKKNKKLIARSEVKITKEFEENFRKFINAQPRNEVKKITPIKITSCSICKLKLIKSTLEEHIARVHKNNDTDSSKSDDELFIDDDVELCWESTSFEDIQHPSIEDGNKIHICLQCPEKFTSEDLLMNHIENIHPIKIKNNFIKNHSTEISPLLNGNKNLITAAGSSTSNSKQKATTSKSSSLNISEESTPKNTVKFKRYDSKSSYICRICSVKFLERMHLNRHITSLHISIVYRCYRCQVCFDKLHLIRKHLNNAHAKYANEVGFIKTINNPQSVSFFQCCFCKFLSKDKQAVDDHLTNEHYEDFEKPEIIDETISTSPDSLDELLLPETKEKLKANLNNQDDDEEGLLTEMIVPSQQNGQNGRNRRAQNDPTFPYRCVRCLRRFSRPIHLRNHACKLNVKLEPPSPKKQKITPEVNGFFKCTNKSCNKVFTDRRYFDEHKKIHYN